MIVEPGQQFLHQLAAHLVIALAHLFADKDGDLEDFPMHAAMTFHRRKQGGLHPAVFLLKMRLGMGDKAVQSGAQVRVRGVGQAIEPVDELAMGIIHGLEAEFVFGFPGSEGHDVGG